MTTTSRSNIAVTDATERPAVDLDPIFKPRSIAIVGASERVGYVVGANKQLHAINYPGAIYPVNPNRQTIWDMPCYPSVASTPTVPEIAFIAVEKERVMGLVEECAAAGVKALIVNSNGYADHPDPRGRQMQEELAACVRAHGMLMVGPNVLGIVNVPGRFATFSFEPNVEPGRLAIISHSGGNTMWLAQAAYERNLGVSYMVSSGNEATLNMCDYIEYLLPDPNVRVFLLFIETIREPERFLRLATRAAEMNKPIVAVKIGRSAEAQKAALAHTGSFTGGDEVVDALFARAGVIRASGMDDAADKCILFAQLPPERWPGGRRAAVFTIGGGLASLTSDLAAARDIDLPPIADALAADLRAAYPEKLTIQNPIDTPAIYAGFMDQGAAFKDQPTKLTSMYVGGCLADPSFDAAVIGSSRMEDPANNTAFLQTLEGIVEQTGKPVLVCQPTALPMSDKWHAYAARSPLAFAASVERGLVALEAAARFQERRRDRDLSAVQHLDGSLRERFRGAIGHEIAAGQKVASHLLTYALLEAYGLPIARQTLATTADDAAAFADEVGYPIVVKLPNSDTTTHKTELGAVRPDLASAAEVKRATGELLDLAKRRGDPGNTPAVVVQEMISGAHEIYLGASAAGAYPPAVLVGVGGIHVEATRDVAIDITPIDAADARRMVERLRSYRILSGFRGRPPADVAAIIDAITRLSTLARDLPQFFEELDINPAMVLGAGQGLRVVDAVLTYRRVSGPILSGGPAPAAATERVPA